LVRSGVHSTRFVEASRTKLRPPVPAMQLKTPQAGTEAFKTMAFVALFKLAWADSTYSAWRICLSFVPDEWRSCRKSNHRWDEHPVVFCSPSAIRFHFGLNTIDPDIAIGRADFSGHSYPRADGMERIKRIHRNINVVTVVEDQIGGGNIPAASVAVRARRLAPLRTGIASTAYSHHPGQRES